MKKRKVMKGVLAAALATTLVSQFAYTAVNANMLDDSDLENKNVVEPEAWGAVPNEAQLQYHEEELAAFVHFGMNTFTDKEWGDGQEDPLSFNPTGDIATYADSYVEALKNAGFKRLIVTAKHHDGFCIWPSAYTEHDIENSPYKDGKGDVLAEISAACTKHNMDMGLYLSPWDVNAESYGYYDENGNSLLDESGNPINGMTMDEVKEKDALDYNDYYVNQITEIVTNPIYGNNGRFVEWWMDGAKGEGGDAQEYDMDRILSTIKENEPGVLIFGGGTDGGIHWIGNEKGQASEETWAKVDSEKGDGYSEADGFTYGIPDGDHWSVPESDVSITAGWFYHDGDNPKSMSQLSKIYFDTIGNGSPLLLNFPPNKTGDLDGTIYSRLNEFKNAIAETFDTNLVTGASASASSVYENALQYSPTKVIDGDDETYWTTEKGTNTGVIEIQFDEAKQFDVVSIEEYITKGQRISEFNVEYQRENGEWAVFGDGKTIGAKKLLRSDPVTATAIRINITGSQAEPMISEVGVYEAADDFKATQPLPAAYTKFVPGDEGLSLNKGSWDDDGKGNTGWHEQADGSYTTTDGWANIKYTFEGTYFALVGTKGPNYGAFDIYIDGKYISSASCSAASETPNQILYESPTLSNGEHSIQLTTGTNRGKVNFAYGYYLGVNENGLFEIEADSYQVNEGDAVKVKIKRNGGSTGEVTVNVTTPPGTAVQGQYYENITNETITFKDGEKTKYITVQTIDNLSVTGNKDFYVEIFTPTGGAELGMKSTARVVIIEDDVRIADAVEQTSNISESWYKAENWAEFDVAYLNAKAAVDNPDLSDDDKMRLSNALLEAYGNLQTISQYTVRNAMIMPDEFDEEKLLEAELGVLDSSHDNIVKDEYLKMVNGNDYSNGRMIDKIKEGNTITVPLNTTHAGTYSFDFDYKATADMTLSISGEGIQSQTVELKAADTQMSTKSIDVIVDNPGITNLVITATGEGMVALDGAKVTLKNVDEGDVTAIEIVSKPSKTVYTVGDELDLTGMQVVAKLKDGTTMDVTNRVTVTGFDSSSEGTKTVTVHYGTEFSATFEIIVKGKVDNVTDGDDNNSTQDPSVSEKPGANNGQNANATDTGDQQTMAIFALGIIISGAVYIVVKRKKEYDHN